MPTRRGYSRRSSSPASNFGEAVKKATVSGTKKVLGGYLKGTQKAADYIGSKLPEKMTKPRVRGGLRKRGASKR